MTIIDKETWPRRAHYDFFTPMSDPFYTLTFPVDVTPLRAWCKGRSLPFYPAMVFAVTKAMEAVDAFHYKDRDGVIVRHDTLVPSFTDLKPGSELFQIITSGPWDGDQLVYFTCLPWFPLTALKNEKDVNPSDSVPRAAWGRWEEKGSRTRLLLSLELNHRLLDGVHVGRFYEALNRWMEGL